MAKIVGIDASLTGTGICELRTEPGLFVTAGDYETHRIETNLRGSERLIEIRDRVKNFCKGAELVVIEGYAFARANQAHQIGELGGVLRVMFYENGFRWVEVTPGQLKKFACGKVGAKKEQVMLGVYKHWGVEFPTNDECDAYVLSRIGESLTNPSAEEKLVVAQREVIAALQNENPKKSKKSKKLKKPKIKRSKKVKEGE